MYRPFWVETKTSSETDKFADLSARSVSNYIKAAEMIATRKGLDVLEILEGYLSKQWFLKEVMYQRTILYSNNELLGEKYCSRDKVIGVVSSRKWL